MKKSRGSEHDHQVAVADWLRAKRIPFFSVPNGFALGSRRGAALGHVAKLKREGMTPGAPDLVICCARPLFIEMKAPGRRSRVSEDQKEFHDRLRSVGHEVEVFDNADAAIKWIDDHLKQMEEEGK